MVEENERIHIEYRHNIDVLHEENLKLQQELSSIEGSYTEKIADMQMRLEEKKKKVLLKFDESEIIKKNLYDNFITLVQTQKGQIPRRD
jgi:hypothetical protein